MLNYIKKIFANRKLKKQQEIYEADLGIWEFYHKTLSGNLVDQMTGRQFEEFLFRLFLQMGYLNVQLTPSNDQGADLVCVSPDGIKTVVQAKRWNRPVGNAAVQEILGAMRFYQSEKGIVVTNSKFTSAARSLAAESADVELYDRQWLDDMIAEFLPTGIPDFCQNTFDEILSNWVEVTRGFASHRTRRRRRVSSNHATFTDVSKEAAEGKGKELSVSEIRTLATLYKDLWQTNADIRRLEQERQELHLHNNALKTRIGEYDDDQEFVD